MCGTAWVTSKRTVELGSAAPEAQFPYLKMNPVDYKHCCKLFYAVEHFLRIQFMDNSKLEKHKSSSKHWGDGSLTAERPWSLPWPPPALTFSSQRPKGFLASFEIATSPNVFFTLTNPSVLYNFLIRLFTVSLYLQNNPFTCLKTNSPAFEKEM